jgi:hypothetical protein
MSSCASLPFSQVRKCNSIRDATHAFFSLYAMNMEDPGAMRMSMCRTHTGTTQ